METKNIVETLFFFIELVFKFHLSSSIYKLFILSHILILHQNCFW
jgi:hypothetical protein